MSNIFKNGSTTTLTAFASKHGSQQSIGSQDILSTSIIEGSNGSFINMTNPIDNNLTAYSTPKSSKLNKMDPRSQLASLFSNSNSKLSQSSFSGSTQQQNESNPFSTPNSFQHLNSGNRYSYTRSYEKGQQSVNTSTPIQIGSFISPKHNEGSAKSKGSGNMSNNTQRLSSIIQSSFLSERETTLQFLQGHLKPSPFQNKVSIYPHTLEQLEVSKEDQQTRMLNQSLLLIENQKISGPQSVTLSFDSGQRPQSKSQKGTLSTKLEEDIRDWLVGNSSSKLEPVTQIKICSDKRPKSPSRFSSRESLGVLNSSSRRIIKKEEIQSNKNGIDHFQPSSPQRRSSIERTQSSIQITTSPTLKKIFFPPIANPQDNTLKEVSEVAKPRYRSRSRILQNQMSTVTEQPQQENQVGTDNNDAQMPDNKVRKQKPNISLDLSSVAINNDGEDEQKGNGTNRYVPSFVGQLQTRPQSPKTKVSSHKGFMKLFQNQDSKNKQPSNNSQSTINLLSSENNSSTQPPALHHTSSLQLIRSHQLPRPQLIQTEETSITVDNNLQKRLSQQIKSEQNISLGLNQQLEMKVKGVLKKKIFQENSISEMETMDESSSNRFTSFSTRLGMSSINGISFQKEADRSDFDQSTFIGKSSSKKRVQFKERVQIVDMITKSRSTTTLSQLENRKA